MNGIFMNIETLERLSSSTRQELCSAIFGPVEMSPSGAEPEPISSPLEGPTDLSPQQVKRFMAGVSHKTRNGLSFIVKQGGRVKMSALVEELNASNWGELRGFHAGITKRTRTITGDKEAYLLEWDEDQAVYAVDDVTYEDGEYFMSKTTLTSFRKYFESISR